MSKLTYKDVIEDTRNYYESHNRGKDGPDECVYINVEGDMCAVGRWAKNPGELEDIQGGDIYGVIRRLADKDITDSSHHCDSILAHYILKDEVAHLNNTNFWSELQIFHDSDKYWRDNKELSLHGIMRYEELLEKWSSVS